MSDTPIYQRYPYNRSTTVQLGPVDKNGMVDPGTRNKQTWQLRVPIGSQNPDGRYTGDFRGLGVVNPWGGRRSRKYRKNSGKSRKNKRNKRK